MSNYFIPQYIGIGIIGIGFIMLAIGFNTTIGHYSFIPIIIGAVIAYFFNYKAGEQIERDRYE